MECNVNSKYCHVSDAHPALPAAEQETARVMCICLTALRDAAATADARGTHFNAWRKTQDTEKMLKDKVSLKKKKNTKKEEKYGACFSACTYSRI